MIEGRNLIEPSLPAQLLLEGAAPTSRRESRMAEHPLDDASDDDEEMSSTTSSRRRDSKVFAGPSLHRHLSSVSLSSIFGSPNPGGSHNESPAIGRRGLSSLSSASQHLAHLDTVPGSRDHLDDLRASRSQSHQPTVPGSRDHLDDLRASRSQSHQPSHHLSIRESPTLAR